MKFDIHQKDFPSTTHKSIWHAAVFMAPFYEVIPPHWKDKQANDLREGEKSLYNFITDLYSDMYQHPETYYLPVGEYDRFMESRNGKKLDSREEKQESNLRNKFQKAIQFYQKLLFEIGTNAKPEAGTQHLSLEKSIFSNVLKKHNLRILQGDAEKRAAALSNVAIEITPRKDSITLSTDKYPKMFTALSALCTSTTSKFALMNVLRCDFRGLVSSHRPGIADVISVLPEDCKKKALDMDSYMRSIKCKITVEPLKNTTLHSGWKLFYKLKGKSVYSFHSDTDGLNTFAYFNHHENVSRMGYLLKEESDLLYNWFFDRIPSSVCSCPNNKRVDIGGREKRICGLMNRIDVINPDEDHLKNLRQVIALYLEKVFKGSP